MRRRGAVFFFFFIAGGSEAARTLLTAVALARRASVEACSLELAGGRSDLMPVIPRVLSTTHTLPRRAPEPPPAC